MTQLSDRFETSKPESGRVSENVASAITASILRGDLRVGDKLPSERALMERFKVGRSAVREALLVLQNRGFVQISNGARASITAPLPDDILEGLTVAAQLLLMRPEGQRTFQSARALIEIGLVRDAAKRAKPREVRELGEILHQNKQHMDDPDGFARCDVAFHFKIAEISGNEFVISLHGALLDWLTDQRAVSGRAPGAADLAITSHEEIYRSILAQDSIAAEDAMERHLDCVSRRYWQMVEAVDG